MKVPSFTKYVAISCVTFVAACQSDMLPDSRIADNTANVLNVAPTSVAISNRHGDGTTTYYNARAAGHTYACEMVGGALWSAGMVDPPTCKRL
jgi:hypothetical protein